MNTTGLSLNVEKTLITDIRKSFNFLGANCRALSTPHFSLFNRRVKGTSQRYTARIINRLHVTAPMDRIMDKLCKNGFIKRNNSGIHVATAVRN